MVANVLIACQMAPKKEPPSARMLLCDWMACIILKERGLDLPNEVRDKVRKQVAGWEKRVAKKVTRSVQ
jgi:hypothetical protein